MSDIEPIIIYNDLGENRTFLTRFVRVNESGTTEYEIVTTTGERKVESLQGSEIDNQGRNMARCIYFDRIRIAEDKVFAILSNDIVMIGTITKPQQNHRKEKSH